MAGPEPKYVYGGWPGCRQPDPRVFPRLSWSSGVLLSLASIASSAQEKEQSEDKYCCTTADTGQCILAVEKPITAEPNDTYQMALKPRSEPSSETETTGKQEARASSAVVVPNEPRYVDGSTR